LINNNQVFIVKKHLMLFYIIPKVTFIYEKSLREEKNWNCY